MKRAILLLAGLFLLVQASLFAQGKFSGYMFGDYYYNIAKDPNYLTLANAGANSMSANPGGTSYQAFQIRRVYFGYSDDISEKFSTLFRLEMDPTTTNTATGNKLGVMVKDASLTWKEIFEGSSLIFGVTATPTFDASEGFWGYRSLEKTIMDLRGVVPSRDYGVGLKGKLTGDGMLNYWVMIADGSGNSPETDKYKRYYGQISVKPNSNFYAMVNFDFQDRAQVADPYNAGKKVSDGTTTLSAFLTYMEPGSFKVGLEGFSQSKSNGFNSGTSLKSLSGMGISVWASANLNPDLAAVVRYDNFDPNTDSNSKGDSRNLIIAGLDCKVDKNVHIEPNLYYESYEAPTGGSAPKAAVVGRITLYWIFL